MHYELATKLPASAKRTWAVSITVEGVGEFPFDMLRYDECFGDVRPNEGRRQMSETIHPFEQAGLGQGPFKFVGAYEKRGPLSWRDEKTGVTLTAGSPGQPMGTCAYCGTGIAICCVIESADGRRFEVGSDCVNKTYMKGSRVLSDALRAIRQLKTDKETKEWQAIREQLGQDSALREAMAARKHPLAFRAEKGETLLDWANWMLVNAGHSGRMDAARTVARVAKSLKAGV